MKKCENCNLILQDSDAFCPKCGGATVECDSGSHAEGETACNCGENCSCGEENRECGEQTAENVQAGPQMQFVDDGKKKKGKKGLIAAIIAAVIVVLGVGAALVYMLVLNTPSKQFLMAQAKMFKTEWSGKTTVADVLKGKGQPVKRDFSSDISVSMDTDNQNFNDILNKLSLDYKIKSEGSEYLLNGELNYNGSPLLSCVLTADENTVGLYVPELSNEYYVTEKGLAEQVFTDEDVGEYDPIEYTKLDDIEKAYNSLVKRYGKILLGGIDDEDVKVEKNVTVKLELLEKEFKGCKVYTYTPDKERIAAALKALSGEMREEDADKTDWGWYYTYNGDTSWFPCGNSNRQDISGLLIRGFTGTTMLWNASIFDLGIMEGNLGVPSNMFPSRWCFLLDKTAMQNADMPGNPSFAIGVRCVKIRETEK